MDWGHNRRRSPKKHVVVTTPAEDTIIYRELRSRRVKRLARKHHKQDLDSDLSGSPKLCFLWHYSYLLDNKQYLGFCYLKCYNFSI